MFLARAALFVLARGLMDRGGEAGVAASAASAAGDYETLVGLSELEKLVAGFVVEDDRAYRNFQNDAVAVASGLV